ncbi:hypothetical protein X943_003488 [Babesia divergens]|uniref:Ribosomal RNA-processing protein 7 C-terminal domain-containing protein n=1 Tax=Babesia divergens TaxID=32595 RepID=A0AAD9G7S8_BABDI|nr:hypothetical protein X943_003488 [Babesia divergens]
MDYKNKDILLFQSIHGLPFYSQVLCTLHRNHGSTASNNALPNNRTLFLKSLDPLVSKDQLIRGLSSLGDVDVTAVSKHASSDGKLPYCRGLYHAVFKNAKVIKKLLGVKERGVNTVIPAKTHISKDTDTFLLSTLKRRRAQYRGMDILQKNADECLMEYDIATDIQRRLDQEVTVDEEGFTLVTTGPEPIRDVTRRSVKRKSTAPATTLNFYRFPNKEAVMAAMQAEATLNKAE